MLQIKTKNLLLRYYNVCRVHNSLQFSLIIIEVLDNCASVLLQNIVLNQQFYLHNACHFSLQKKMMGIIEDAKWDGLKGYLTNTKLLKEDVIKQYHELWQIEKAFIISKSDLEMRPIYHQLKKRIEAHICIAFAACKKYKELERQLIEKKAI